MKLTILFTSLLFVGLSFAQNRITPEQYIEQWKITAIENMNSHGIPASITLAQGILESGSGNSKLAREANNHFGIKCHKGWDGMTFIQDDDTKNECFRSYDNAAQSYRDHSEFLTGRDRYSSLFSLSLTDYKSWSKGLKKAGYATNPKYADLLINLIEKYELHQYDLMPYLPENAQKKKAKESLSVRPDKNDVVAKQKHPSTNAKEIEYAIGGHDVSVNKYNKRYIVVQEGDTFYRLSKEFQMSLWQLYSYNDLGKRDVLTKGEIIYLDPKRTKSRRGENVFVCRSQMTLREISQQEGIKLKKLVQYNLSEDADTVLAVGTKVILR
ncbi:glucosaminidase domain-containing protein [Crocinitomix catalasitica]|uniref:glucosaminidase domain-containing protein n=1 Tax=Crocinitomix catalasitica TaxID=184607 RepID=UPI0004877F6B|nr:glucosaminidase domain-containing protein [Crocinitomix catalasitica]